MSTASSRRIAIASLFGLGGLLAAYSYWASLVPAVHQDHDHALENLDAGGRLVVELASGQKRNLVGKPAKLLVLHWTTAGNPEAGRELASLGSIWGKVGSDPALEVLVIFSKTPGWTEAKAAAQKAGVPEGNLALDKDGEIASLFGAKRLPETMIYGLDGHLVHQARGATDWQAPTTDARLASLKAGGTDHEH